MTRNLLIAALVITLTSLLATPTRAATGAEEYDAVIKKAPKPAADGATTLPHEKVVLDTQGAVVKRFIREGLVTKATKIAMGKFNEKRKIWEPGDPIPGGIAADIFTDAATTLLQVRITTTDDKKTIAQLLVKQVGGELAKASPEFDALLKSVVDNGLWYVRLELDDKGKTVKSYALSSAHTTTDTAVVMGKYDEKTKKWEPGEAIEGGLHGAPFKDLAKSPVPVRLTIREDGKALAQVLVKTPAAPSK